jgi:hypothetical protein
MFVRDQDFVCETKHGIVRCIAKSIPAISAFKVLQMQLARLLPQLPEAPSIDIDVNGIIGPSTALGVQVLGARLAQGSHQGLAEIIAAQPEQAIPDIAARALEITGYIDSVIEKDPHAISAPGLSQTPPVDPITQLRSIFSIKRVAAATVTLLGLGAMVWVGSAAHRRALGLVDRSSFLPRSDGTDEFEESDDDGTPDDGIDRDGAIDVEAVEHAA